MKLAALFFAIALPALAETPAPPATAASVCKEVGRLAEILMRNRQDGVPLSLQMTLLDGADAIVAPLMREMITSAYDAPRWHTEESKRRAVDDHRDVFEVACFEMGVGQ